MTTNEQNTRLTGMPLPDDKIYCVECGAETEIDCLCDDLELGR